MDTSRYDEIQEIRARMIKDAVRALKLTQEHNREFRRILATYPDEWEGPDPLFVGAADAELDVPDVLISMIKDEILAKNQRVRKIIVRLKPYKEKGRK